MEEHTCEAKLPHINGNVGILVNHHGRIFHLAEACLEGECNGILCSRVVVLPHACG